VESAQPSIWIKGREKLLCTRIVLRLNPHVAAVILINHIKRSIRRITKATKLDKIGPEKSKRSVLVRPKRWTIRSI
jgi:hypothetical protein